MFCYHCGNKILEYHKFCTSCGEKIDLTFINYGKSISLVPSKTILDYKDLIYRMEATLKRQSSLSDDEFCTIFGKFKNYNYKKDSDEGLFWKLVQVIFYSGMKAAIVTSKLPALKKYLYDYNLVKDYKKEQIDRILNDPNIIRNRSKIEACVNNAIIYNEIINKYDSFSNYIESFGNTGKESVLERIKNDLRRFEFLGPITAYHFMLDMGLKVWKPDRVICRILNRLGLLDDIQNIEQAVKQGREIADQVGEPIRYIDIIFVKYGQQGDEEPFGLKTGICLEKNPRCSICGIIDYCKFKA